MGTERRKNTQEDQENDMIKHYAIQQRSGYSVGHAIGPMSEKHITLMAARVAGVEPTKASLIATDMLAGTWYRSNARGWQAIAKL
jgi:hypothetical protein